MSVRFGNRLRRRQGGVTYRPPPKAGEIKMVRPPRQPWQGTRGCSPVSAAPGGQCGAKSVRAGAVGTGTEGECATTSERAMLGAYLRGGTAAGE